MENQSKVFNILLTLFITAKNFAKNQLEKVLLNSSLFFVYIPK